MNKRMLGYWIGTGAMLLGAIVSVAIIGHSHASNLSLILVSIMVGGALSQYIRAWWHMHTATEQGILRLSLMWSLCAMVMAYAVH